MTVQTTTETITPDTARAYLGENHSNRHIRLNYVATLAREMREGRWRQNGQGIAFADTGRLLDGQHRLEAIIASGASVEMQVTRGLDEGAFYTMDQGLKRSASDDLGVLGITNPTRVASAARLVLLWLNGLNQKATVTKAEITAFVQDHRDIIDIVAQAQSARNVMPYSALAAVAWLAQRDPANVEKWAAFQRSLESGTDLSDGNPILALRATAFALRRGTNLPADTWFSFVAQTWNDVQAGKTRRSLKSFAWPDRIVGYPDKRPKPTNGAPLASVTQALHAAQKAPHVETAPAYDGPAQAPAVEAPKVPLDGLAAIGRVVHAEPTTGGGKKPARVPKPARAAGG